MRPQPAHAARRAGQRIGIAALDAPQFFPAQRHGDRCAFARPQRKGRHAGGAAPIAQVVDEDPALAELLGRGGYIGKRIGGGHRVGEGVCERLYLRPRTRWLQRHHHVQALAPRGADERREPQGTQAFAHQARGLHHARPRHVGARVEIEDDAVRQVRGVGPRAPGMEFQRVELHQFEQTGLIAHHQVIRTRAALLVQRHHLHPIHAGRVVLLEEARPPCALRTSHHRQRTPVQLGQQPACHRTVVVEHLLFGDAAVRKDHALGMGQFDRGAGGVRARGRQGGISGRGTCFTQVRRPLAEGLQRGLAQQTLIAVAVMEHLGDQARHDQRRGAVRIVHVHPGVGVARALGGCLPGTEQRIAHARADAPGIAPAAGALRSASSSAPSPARRPFGAVKPTTANSSASRCLIFAKHRRAWSVGASRAWR